VAEVSLGWNLDLMNPEASDVDREGRGEGKVMKERDLTCQDMNAKDKARRDCKTIHDSTSGGQPRIAVVIRA
jgi:hypothetical protein